MVDEREKILLERMRALCAGREYCEADIRRKLSQAMAKDVAEKNVAETDFAGQSRMTDRIIASLKEDRFIDEARYASAFARDKSSISGWGKVKIRHCLAGRGISGKCIEKALAGIAGNPGLSRLEKALAVKSLSLKDDPQRKLKLLRFALGRGYEYDEIRGLVDKVMADTGE